VCSVYDGKLCEDVKSEEKKRKDAKEDRGKKTNLNMSEVSCFITLIFLMPLKWI
jgi:hypothetical protein